MSELESVMLLEVVNELRFLQQAKRELVVLPIDLNIKDQKEKNERAIEK